jgi:large subunit ribosomal protein L10
MRTRVEKEAEVTELRERAARANALILADYRGLTVSDANDLRGRLRAIGEGNIEYRVTKNTLLRIALSGTDLQAIEPLLAGPTAVALAFDEPSVLAKALVDYAKENEKFEIKGGFIDGEVVDLAEVRALAALPGKDELRSQLMSAIQAPMQNLTSTLYALLGNMRNALEQRQNQLES